MSNQILLFCPTDTGTNLDTNAEYSAASDRTNGNQTGVAKSKLVNKALRQSSFLANRLAQYIGDTSGVDVADPAGDIDATAQATLLSQIQATLQRLAPVPTIYSSGSGSHNISYYFFIASGSATAGATYTNNAVTFTVGATVAAGTLVRMTGAGAPSASGTLTKASGTGDATLTFYAVRAPIAIQVELAGGGGGGGGAGGGGTGGTGGTTSFGTSLLSANGGVGGTASGTGGTGGAGGTSSLGTGPIGLALTGGDGATCGFGGAGGSGGSGGSNAWGGSGRGNVGATAAPGQAGKANTGAGGGGAAATGGSNGGGGGGGAGGYVKAWLSTMLSTFAYAVGAAGTAGSGTDLGGAGALGGIFVTEYFQ